MVNRNAGAFQGSFEARLLTAHPETALIYELGAQLRGPLMPIVDWEDLLKKLQTQEMDPGTLGFPPLDNLPDEPCAPPRALPPSTTRPTSP